MSQIDIIFMSSAVSACKSSQLGTVTSLIEGGSRESHGTLTCVFSHSNQPELHVASGVSERSV